MEVVQLKCTWCGKEFERPAKEQRRRAKTKSHRVFCSLSCSSKFGHATNPRSEYPDHLRVFNEAAKKPNARVWWLILRRIREKDPNHNLSYEFLERLLRKQAGLCALTGIPLEMSHKGIRNKNTRVSLDRIDNSKGYTKDNVQLVVVTANLAKNSGANDDFWRFLALAFKHRSKVTRC